MNKIESSMKLHFEEKAQTSKTLFSTEKRIQPIRMNRQHLPTLASSKRIGSTVKEIKHHTRGGPRATADIGQPTLIKINQHIYAHKQASSQDQLDHVLDRKSSHSSYYRTGSEMGIE